jgi:uncharacterized membrane protein
METEKSMVALFDTHLEAEKAINKLQKSGFKMKQLSIIGKDYHSEENVVGYYNIGDRMLNWGSVGAFWGSIWGLLFGSAFFMIPGFGPLLIAGPFVAALVASLEGAVAVGSLGAIGGALSSIGIADNSILEYETELKAGKFMLIAHGTHEEVEKAREVLDVAVHV